MNSVLQCLTHTPPLAEVLLSPRPLAISHSRGSAGVAGQVRSLETTLGCLVVPRACLSQGQHCVR